MSSGIRYIKNLVRQGEHDHLEFKRKAAHPEKIVREVVAFANSAGGKLLVGVDDNGDTPGVKFPEEEEYILNKAIAELCSPKIDYQLEIVKVSEYDEHAILVYDIPEGKRKPYYAREKKNDKFGKAYIRLADKSIQASREVVGVLKSKKRNEETGFEYGEQEKILMKYLEANNRITVTEYQELAKLPYHLASKKLILLTANNVLRIDPREKVDYFYFSEVSPFS
ncbi:MAG: ATP-binding protein [Cyclobacteriaceae bacterium]